MPEFDPRKLLAAAVEADDAWLAANMPPEAERPTGRPTRKPNDKREKSDDQAEGVDLNEIADKNAFVEEHIDSIRFCPQIGKNGTWFIWTGQLWEEDETSHIMRLCEATVLRLSAELMAEAAPIAAAIEEELSCYPPDKQTLQDLRKQHGALMRQAKQLQTKTRMESIIGLAKCDQRVLVSPTALDADPHILNCPNGMVDLRTGKLLKHDRERYCTRITNVDYDPTADTT